MTMDNLDKIRTEINEIDTEISKLFCRRMDCAAQVADYKAALGIAVTDAKRERAVLDRVRELTGEYAPAAEIVFATMMDVSRALQHGRLASGQEFLQSIEHAQLDLPPTYEARVVCQGVPGAFSDEAAAMLFPGARPSFVSGFGDVFAQVESGAADYGILPVENAFAGSVHEVYDLMTSHRLTITAAAEVSINHCLLCRHGADISKLSAVLSHPQALSQCAEFLTANGIAPLPYSNTAAAAAEVAAKSDDTLGAIASRRAAELYGLEVARDGIQTLSNNYTRFVAISHKSYIPPDADKISLLFALPHVTGSLYHILTRFASVGLNLTKLESRPTRGADFSYVFYVDFEGSLRDEATKRLLCALSEELTMFTFLGNYRDISSVAVSAAKCEHPME